jgi:hypothetical protein
MIFLQKTPIEEEAFMHVLMALCFHIPHHFLNLFTLKATIEIGLEIMSGLNPRCFCYQMIPSPC